MSFNSTCPSCGSVTETTKSEWLWGKQRPKCSRCGATLTARGRRKPKPRRSTKPKLKMKPKVLQAYKEFDHAIALAADHGITVVYREVTTARRNTLHVMFNRDKYRVADWWPGTTKIILAGGRQAVADNIEDALRMAMMVDLQPVK